MNDSIFIFTQLTVYSGHVDPALLVKGKAFSKSDLYRDSLFSLAEISVSWPAAPISTGCWLNSGWFICSVSKCRDESAEVRYL